MYQNINIEDNPSYPRRSVTLQRRGTKPDGSHGDKEKRRCFLAGPGEMELDGGPPVPSGHKEAEWRSTVPRAAGGEADAGVAAPGVRPAAWPPLWLAGPGRSGGGGGGPPPPPPAPHAGFGQVIY